MPAILKKKTKSTRLSDDEEEHTLPIDVQYNPEMMNGYLQDLESKLNEKTLHIQKEINFMKGALKNAFQMEIVKIPKDVKQMSLSRFREEFGESIDAVNRSNQGGSKFAAQHVSKPLQTPSHFRGGSTLMRAPVEGEKILSLNGSPLGEFCTVMKDMKGSKSVIPQTPGVFLPLQAGGVVDLDEIASLPEEQKKEALAKIKSMMDTMQTVVSKLQRQG